jgi:hypothetical protein
MIEHSALYFELAAVGVVSSFGALNAYLEPQYSGYSSEH